MKFILSYLFLNNFKYFTVKLYLDNFLGQTSYLYLEEKNLFEHDTDYKILYNRWYYL